MKYNDINVELKEVVEIETCKGPSGMSVFEEARARLYGREKERFEEKFKSEDDVRKLGKETPKLDALREIGDRFTRSKEKLGRGASASSHREESPGDGSSGLRAYLESEAPHESQVDAVIGTTGLPASSSINIMVFGP